MPRKQLQKFAELSTFANVYEEPAPMRGTWAKDVFNNDKPLIVELGCGYAEHCTAISRENSNKNFVGIDNKGARLWQCARLALEENRSNVALLRIRIEFLSDHFTTNEIDELWIPFPDPFPNKASRRLVSPRFLNDYKNILKPNGVIHFKTDNTDLYLYCLEMLEKHNCLIHTNNPDLYGEDEDNMPPYVNTMTRYARRHINKGEKIKYVGFSFREE